jgi:serine/threonine protein phosphatase PrpC
MDYTVASRSDVGRVRTNNQDNFLVDKELGLYVVPDGMGGHNAGEVASRTACEVLQRELAGLTKQREKYTQSGKSSDIKALAKGVEAAMVAACKAIYKTSSKNPDQAGMGCTCTLMFLAGNNKGILGHVGDSRLYVVRSGAVHQLSEDHTFVNELLKRGAITKAQAKNHPQGNVLSRAMGPDRLSRRPTDGTVGAGI